MVDINTLEKNILKYLYNHPWEFIHSKKLEEIFGVDHNKVQRVINNLRRKGFIISSHPRKGYIFKLPDDLSKAQNYLLSALVGGFYWHAEYFHKVTSTQDVAKEYAERWKVPSGYIIIAEEMSEGRGRYGRKWYAPKGGLWFTIILRPKRFDVLSLLPIAAGVAIAQAIKTVTDIDVRLKWPNDILYEGKKLGGILTEASIYYNKIYHVLLGIGINVNNEIPEEIKDIAINLKEIWGKPVPRVVLFKSIIHHFAMLYYYMKYKRHELVINEWKKYSETLGKRIKVVAPGETFEGTAVDLKENGALVVVDSEGNERIVFAGEVIHLR